ncbi:MAG: hypothetical protein ABEJ93_01460 [Candidatus Nanohalobium sp.]
MNKRKGMSQILTLIVAASVLMMTALTLIIMTQGSLTDLLGGSNRQSCINTIKAQCTAATDDIRIPRSCKTLEDTKTTLQDIHTGGNTGDNYKGGSTYTCPSGVSS